MLAQAAGASRTQALSRNRPVRVEELKSGDTAENSLRMNVQGTLDDLASSTGGFLIANTNDFLKGMQRVSTDISTYYPLSYAARARKYDGSFRAITVKFSRPGLAAQTRS